MTVNKQSLWSDTSIVEHLSDAQKRAFCFSDANLPLATHLHSHPAPSSPGLASVLTLNFGSSALLSGPLQHIAPIVG